MHWNIHLSATCRILRDIWVALIGGHLSCPFWGHLGCPYWGTFELPFLGNIWVALIGGHLDCPYWGTLALLCAEHLLNVSYQKTLILIIFLYSFILPLFKRSRLHTTKPYLANIFFQSTFNKDTQCHKDFCSTALTDILISIHVQILSKHMWFCKFLVSET